MSQWEGITWSSQLAKVKKKNQEVGVQVKTLLHSKINNQQNEKAAYIVGEYMCNTYI